MESLLITPGNKKEMAIILNFIEKMKVRSRLLSQDDLEDIGMAYLMNQADKDDKVAEEEILRELNDGC